MDRTADVVIIGAGIAGTAAAYHLAKGGSRVVVCEKGEIAGEQSSRNWGFVRQQDGIQAGPPPDLSIVTFRYLPKSGSANEFNRKLVDAIRDDGRVFLTSTTMNDKFVIRLAVLGYNTHLDDVETALAVIRESIADVSGHE